MSRKEKEKLLRIAKRSRKGPFNTVMDPSEYKAGDGIVELSTAVKESGSYDPWGVTGLAEIEAEEGIVPKIRKVKVSARLAHTGERSLIRLARHLRHHVCAIKLLSRQFCRHTRESHIIHPSMLTKNSFMTLWKLKKSD